MFPKFVILSLAFLLVQTGTAAGFPLATDLDSDPNLQGWWKFEGSAADSSSHKRNGSLAAGSSFIPGPIGEAVELEEYGVVHITGYKGVTGVGPRSIAVWMKTDLPKGEVVSWGTKDFGRMWKLCFYRNHIGANPEGGYFYAAADIHDNEWHHVAVVVQQAELPNLHDDVTLYLDGEIAEIDNIGLLDLWPIETEAGEDVIIGAGYRGAVDDLRIYDRELTDEEVAALYVMGK